MNELLFQYVQTVETKIQQLIDSGIIKPDLARRLINELISMQRIAIDITQQIERCEYQEVKND